MFGWCRRSQANERPDEEEVSMLKEKASADMDAFVPSDSKSGRHPPDVPLSLSQILIPGTSKYDWKLMRSHFLNQGRLSMDAAMHIIESARKAFATEPNMLELDGDTIVVGDIHGQFLDLIIALELGGDAATNKYLFLGDYVDRGAHSTEVVLLLFAMKLTYPRMFWMLRGNHESRLVSENFGFLEECLVKYDSEILWDEFCETFDSMPVTALITLSPDNRVFCCHGGLSPHIKRLEQIAAFNRFEEPPEVGPLADFLWNDPYDGEPSTAQELNAFWEVEYVDNPLRGCCFMFGAKVVDEFLKENNLKSIVRAHQVQWTGFNNHAPFMTRGATVWPPVMTVFSAPHYCGTYNNTASLLKLTSVPNLERKFYTVMPFGPFEDPDPDSPDFLDGDIDDDVSVRGATGGRMEKVGSEHHRMMARMDKLLRSGDAKAYAQEAPEMLMVRRHHQRSRSEPAVKGGMDADRAKFEAAKANDAANERRPTNNRGRAFTVGDVESARAQYRRG